MKSQIMDTICAVKSALWFHKETFLLCKHCVELNENCDMINICRIDYWHLYYAEELSFGSAEAQYWNQFLSRECIPVGVEEFICISLGLQVRVQISRENSSSLENCLWLCITYHKILTFSLVSLITGQRLTLNKIFIQDLRSLKVLWDTFIIDMI